MTALEDYICIGCGEEFPKLETQLDGKDYCNEDCFIKHNMPCKECGDIIPINEGVHYKNKGCSLCWECITKNHQPRARATN